MYNGHVTDHVQWTCHKDEEEEEDEDKNKVKDEDEVYLEWHLEHFHGWRFLLCLMRCMSRLTTVKNSWHNIL